VSVRGVHTMAGRSTMLHRNLKRNKNPGSTNDYPKFGQLIVRKIIKIIATRRHILRLKCTKFNSQCLSVCPLYVVWHIGLQDSVIISGFRLICVNTLRLEGNMPKFFWGRCYQVLRPSFHANLKQCDWICNCCQRLHEFFSPLASQSSNR